jgi:hypothetical protein
VDPGICAAKDSHPASFIGQAVAPKALAKPYLKER